jgi:hypothetical protein
MSIDTSGKWWVGTNPDDIKEYLQAYTSGGHKAHEFRLAKCACGSVDFHLDADDAEGVAKRTCSECSQHHFLCDSEEFAEEAEFERWRCECGSEITNVGVGFSLRKKEGEIRWLYVGCRCAKCGILGCFAGWKIDYAPSRQLFDRV